MTMQQDDTAGVPTPADGRKLIRCPRCRTQLDVGELRPDSVYFCPVIREPDGRCDYPLFLAPDETPLPEVDDQGGRAVLPGESGRQPRASRPCLVDSCRALNDRRATHCVECGAPLDALPEPEPEPVWVPPPLLPIVRTHTVPTWWERLAALKWWWIGTGVALALGLLWLMLAID